MKKVNVEMEIPDDMEVQEVVQRGSGAVSYTVGLIVQLKKMTPRKIQMTLVSQVKGTTLYSGNYYTTSSTITPMLYRGTPTVDYRDDLTVWELTNVTNA